MDISQLDELWFKVRGAKNHFCLAYLAPKGIPSQSVTCHHEVRKLGPSSLVVAALPLFSSLRCVSHGRSSTSPTHLTESKHFYVQQRANISNQRRLLEIHRAIGGVWSQAISSVSPKLRFADRHGPPQNFPWLDAQSGTSSTTWHQVGARHQAFGFFDLMCPKPWP